MEKNSVYSGMVNMRKLTMINPAALAGSSSGDDKADKGVNSIRVDRRRRSDRRCSDKKD